MASTRNPAAMEDGTQELTRLAIFDYDGTIVSGQSGLLISRYMFSLKLMKKRHVSCLIWWGIRYLLHLPHREGEARELERLVKAREYYGKLYETYNAIGKYKLPPEKWDEEIRLMTGGEGILGSINNMGDLFKSLVFK